MISLEARIHKARQRRYKKPLVKDLNFDAINEWLWEISETCEDILDGAKIHWRE